MTLPISPQFPVPEGKRRGRLWRIAGIAIILIALFLLAKLTGWIFFHGVVAPNDFAPAPLVGLWNAVIFRAKNYEFVFDTAAFLAGIVVVGLIIATRRVTRRFAIAGQQRLARWESVVEPKEWPKLEGELRVSPLQWITTFAQIGGGTALLIGIWFTYQNLKATREGQITDRFIRAVEQLGAINKDGKPAREIRLGGIYGLRRIAQDSSEDYRPVREVLNDYVRLNAPWPPKEIGAEKPGQPWLTASGRAVHPEADIQAALDFLGSPIEKFEKVTPTSVDLPDTDLRGAELSGTRLWGAVLIGSHLEGAELSGAELSSTLLEGAHLEHADLIGAALPTQEEMNSNFGNADTKLSPEIVRPESWQ